ncbi:LAMI_0E06942g1_1 [Lachancea mirantina]|uniref:LAMI_0E06942g1_1 n=1 Tax=Lachancea mirantina TaxID=1230905 RepID=A0A1G4JM57_9SACH|nr:LAMI_0E06942g1_1 [Lachancea mirantina]
MTFPVISLKPSYNSIIRGCPGLAETLPRLECELRIRSNDGKPFVLSNIEVIFRTIESLNSSGHSFSSKPKLEKETVHCRKNIKVSDKRLIGIDVPITIAIPEGIKQTNLNPKFGQCYSVLECTAYYFLNAGTTTPLKRSFFSYVNVERFDVFASLKDPKPLRRQQTSPDGKFVVKYTFNNSLVTVDDLLQVEVEIIPNLSALGSHATQKIFNKKSKFKSMTCEFKELLEVHDAHVDFKENLLKSTNRTFNETIGASGIKVQSEIRICTRNELFKQYEQSMSEPAVLFRLPNHEPDLTTVPKTVLLKNKNRAIPYNYHTSVTTRGSLFSITHAVTLRLKISNAKDFEMTQPIEVTPWLAPHTKHIAGVVAQEREIARNARAFYESFGGLTRNKHTGELEYPSLPPVVYTADRNTLVHHGILYSISSEQPQRIPVIE